MSGSSSTTDLRNRVIFTIFILAVYRFGTFVPLPGIDPEQLKIMMDGNQKGLLGMFNVFAGGAVSRMAIFALGIMPYISSAIIVQLLTGVSDYFKNLKAQGETGRAKITQITRYGTVLLATVQGYGLSVGLESSADLVINPGATNGEINYNGVVVKEISPIMKLNLRGKKREFLTNIGKNLNLLLPTEANTSTISDKLTAIWLSPDEWMIITNDLVKKDTNEYQLNELLFNDISKKNLGAVIDVTDQFVQLEIKGKNIYEIFSAGSPFNFNEFKDKKGSSAQTILNHIDVIVHNKGDEIVNLFVRRSFAKHLWSWIKDCASRL